MEAGACPSPAPGVVDVNPSGGERKEVNHSFLSLSLALSQEVKGKREGQG